MDQHINLRIVLENPPAGVDFGLQKGKGHDYETIEKQRSVSKNLYFNFTVPVKMKNEIVSFYGPIVQGTPASKFIYIGIGIFAGQEGSAWSRRLKVPLTGISAGMITQLLSDPELVLETHVPGTGKDSGPNCGTVKPFMGWVLKNREAEGLY